MSEPKAMSTPNARRKKRFTQFKQTNRRGWHRMPFRKWNVKVEEYLAAHAEAIKKLQDPRVQTTVHSPDGTITMNAPPGWRIVS